MRLVKTSNSSSKLYLNNGCVVYFSYETPIAIERDGMILISENEWGATTGKHLNAIDRDKSIRVPHKQVKNTLDMMFDII